MRAITRTCLVGCLSAVLSAFAGCQRDDSVSDATMEAELDEWPGTVALADESWKVGSNHAEFTLLDEGGEPIEGAQVTISPWMPAHGHGSIDVEAEESEPGVYVTDRLSFNMPGVWELRLYVAVGDAKGRLATTIEVP